MRKSPYRDLGTNFGFRPRPLSFFYPLRFSLLSLLVFSCLDQSLEKVDLKLMREGWGFNSAERAVKIFIEIAIPYGIRFGLGDT